MPLLELSVSGYRSLRSVRLPLGQLNVVTGANGSGKSNLYKALWLIARIGEGDFAPTIAREGGMLSVMWAGPRTNPRQPVRMTLGFRTDALSFELSCGFPQPMMTFFKWDPEIKEEAVWVGAHRKPSTTLLHRKVGLTWVRDCEGNRVDYPLDLAENESVLSQLRDPHRFPELLALREEIRRWRFYHVFRTDDEAPLRGPRVSVRTPVLSHDGSDLAATLQTIREIGDSRRLEQAISKGLPGKQLCIVGSGSDAPKSPASTELCVGIEVDGCVRPLLGRELSDGTLKYLCLVAALLSPRPPALIALNEPESSLHSELIPPLAKLIVDAAGHSQVWVSTHSRQLVEAIRKLSGVDPIELQLHNGETIAEVPEAG